MSEEQISTPVEPSAEEAPQIVSEVSGETVHFQSGLAGSVSAQQDAEVTDSLVGGVAAGRDLQATNTLVMGMAVGRDATLSNCFTATATVGGNIEAANSSMVTAIGSSISARNSSIGVALGREINLGEGAQVTLTTRQAVAMGAAFGVAFAIFNRLLRRR
ncbi:MAG: hypothetical protein JW987_13040 [Anaerolineaceae bacterium]|nr:hypothetical protein [Anaerolineaceae bacterium]